jgi:hypothetical protein
MMPATITTDGPGPGACLDDLLASRFLPRRWAKRIWSASDLPSRLEHCARNLAPDTEWRAYGDDDRIFFAIARLHVAKPGAPASTAIDVYFLDNDAAVYCAGVWEYDRAHGWWLDDVLDLSYDCEHGWWFDALRDPATAGDRRASNDRRGEGDRRISADRRGAIDRRSLLEPGVLTAPSGGGETRNGEMRNGEMRGAEMRQLTAPGPLGDGERRVEKRAVKLRRGRP